jgi:hypothetical protein
VTASLTVSPSDALACAGALLRGTAARANWLVTRTLVLLGHGAACASAVALSGLIGGQARASVVVSENGMASYSVPIIVPPGVAGMEPKLALSYSSGGINGPAGQGWSIQGLSMITRCAATPATDGPRGVVAYAPTDKLCLDGQRLIATDEGGALLATTTQDASGLASGYREYRTEKDTFSRIRAYGVANSNGANGPSYFKVWTKAGQIYEYGNTTDSRIEAQGKSAVMVWAVSKISDTTGNFIDFRYEERDVLWGSGTSSGITPGKEWNLIRVRYTGRSGRTPPNRVDFYYTDRAFGRSEAFHHGSKNVSVRLLTEIRTFVNQQTADPLPNDAAQPGPQFPSAASNSVPVKAYRLEYQAAPSPGTARNRLARIKECSGRNPDRCMPPHEFSYANAGSEAFAPAALASLIGRQLYNRDGTVGVLAGDFDGDGKTDVLRWADDPAQNQLLFSRQAGYLESPLWMFEPSTAFNLVGVPLASSSGCFRTIVRDFNADGRADILRYAWPGPGGLLSHPTCPAGGVSRLYLSNGNGSFSAPVDLSALNLRKATNIQLGGLEPTHNCPAQSGGRNFYVGDFNGDGFADIITAILPSVGATNVTPCPDQYACTGITCNALWLGSATGAFEQAPASRVPQRSMYTDPASDSLPSPTALDINDDGIEDFASLSGGRVYLFSETGFTQRDVAVSGWCGDIVPLDLNNDRRLDYLCPSSPRLFVGLGGLEGHVAVEPFNLTSESLANFARDYGVVGVDVNGDGRTDLMRWGNDPALNRLWLSNGDGTFTQSSSFNLGGVPIKNVRNQSNPNGGSFDFVVGDFTGRGQTEILRVADAANDNVLWIRTPSLPADHLVQVKTPTGAVASVTYEWLTSTIDPVYASDAGGANAAVYPLVDIRPPIAVVKSIDMDAGVGTLVTTQRHFYRGMKATYAGRGNLGFREVQRERQASDANWLTVVSRLGQDYPFTGLSTEVLTRLGRVNLNGPGDQGGQLLSRTRYTYCDRVLKVGSCPDETSTQITLPMVRKPYVQRTVEEGWDLANPGISLPTVTTVNQYNDSGDPTRVVVTTTGTVAGSAYTSSKTTTNQYAAPNTTGDAWILGRLESATVQSSVPSVLPTASPGSAHLAAATDGLEALNEAPTIGSLSVFSNSGIEPATVVLTVTANDPENALNRVEFYNNGAPLGNGVRQGSTNEYRFAWSSVAAGTYSNITARAYDTPGRSSALSNSVGFFVDAQNNQAPIVGTLSVFSNTGTAPATVVLSVTATDPGGAVSRVEFYNNGVLLGNGVRQGSSDVFRYSWGSLAAGTYSNITARAYDTPGLSSGLSNAVSFVVNPAAPTAILSTGGVSRVGTAASVPMTVSTVAGAVTVNVANGSPPFTYAWTNELAPDPTFITTPGNTATPVFSAILNAWNQTISESFYVRVTDQLGRISVAGPLLVVISSPAAPNQAPTIGSLSVLSNSGTAPATVVLSVNATDPESALNRVEFYNNGVPLGNGVRQGSTNEYRYTWSSVAAGSYSNITARSYDTPGLSSGLSNVVGFTVNAPNQAPTIGSLSVASNSGTAPATVVLSVNATDPENALSRVEFYNNGVLLGSGVRQGSTNEYRYTWSSVVAGSYSNITARSYDTPGLSSGLSNAVGFTVNAPNQAPTIGSLSVASNSGTSPATVVLSVNATDPESALNRVEFYNNGVLLGSGVRQGSTSEYLYTWTSVAAGSYSNVTARAFDTPGLSSSLSNAVGFTVNAPNQAPTIGSLSVLSNSGAAPATVVLSVSATDPEGAVSRVEFYNNGVLLGNGVRQGSTNEYRYTWSSLAAGSYSNITARAFDTPGLSSGLSNAVGFVVNPPAPTASLSTTSIGRVGTATSLPMTVSTLAGAVTVNVANGSPPFSYAWSNQMAPDARITTPGNTASPVFSAIFNLWSDSIIETFYVTVTDQLGRTSIAGPLSVSLSSPAAPNQAPTIGSLSVASNSGTAPATVVLSVNATDPENALNRVEFYNNGVLLGSGVRQGSTNEYRYTWSSLAAGSYSNITARAFDTPGLSSGLSNAVGFTVNPPNQAPSVGSLSVASNSGTAPATVVLSVTATDQEGALNRVEFYNNGVLLGNGVQQGSTSEYRYTWTSVAAGSYSNITARSFDAPGLSSGLSNAVGFTVNPAAPPLSVGLSTTAISAVRNVSAGQRPTLSGSLTATASGGSGSYTLSWTRLSGDTRIAVSPNPVSAASQLFTFSATMNDDDFAFATFRLTVTDSLGAQTFSANVTVSFTVNCTSGMCP